MESKSFINGNATITMNPSGSRVVQYDTVLDLSFPLSVDIKMMKEDIFKYSIEEENIVNYPSLREEILVLPMGSLLEIRSNRIDIELIKFLEWTKEHSYYCNLIIHQDAARDWTVNILELIEESLIKSLFILVDTPESFNKLSPKILEYKWTTAVLSVGIHTPNMIDEVIVKNVYITGYSVYRGLEFGDKEDLEVNILWWTAGIKPYIGVPTCSFDFLAIIQLQIWRQFEELEWNAFQKNDDDITIDAVNKTFYSVKVPEPKSWLDMNIREFFDIVKETPSGVVWEEGHIWGSHLASDLSDST